MKLFIAITNLGRSKLEKFGAFLKMDVPGHGTPHVFAGRSYDETQLAEFHRDLQACARDSRYNNAYCPVVVIATADEKAKPVIAQEKKPDPAPEPALAPETKARGVLAEMPRKRGRPKKAK